MPSTTYRVQRRGGKGIRGQVLREEDALRHMVIAHARDNMLFFTNRGKVYQLKAYQIPEYERTARGHPDRSTSSTSSRNEMVTAVLAAPDFENNEFLLMATRMGEIKKTSLLALRHGAVQWAHRDGHRAGRRAGLGEALPRRQRRDPGQRAGPGAALPHRRAARGLSHQRRRSSASDWVKAIDSRLWM